MAFNGIPNALITRRLHSLTGIWLTVFLMQHLLVNSQAAYFFGDDGKGFIHAVNSIQDLPYLPIIELAILGLPIFVHMIWGFKILWTAKFNSFGSDKAQPILSQYPRNRSYTWQRITSYLLVFGIIGHVVQMRFIEYPTNASVGHQEYYMVLVNLDDGIYTLSKRLDVELYDHNKIQIKKKLVNEEAGFFDGLFEKTVQNPLPDDKIKELIEKQKLEEYKGFLQALEKHPVKKNQAIAVAKDFGTAELLMLRETFKIPIMIALYTLFVLSACFHAFNGLWTFLISWGVTLSVKSQNLFRTISYGLMLIFSFLGLSAIYATYWINLKQ